MDIEEIREAEPRFNVDFEEEIREKKLTSEAVSAFQKVIYAYFRKHGRRLPWRETNDPYHILVSEIMLQQTQVERVTEKYEEVIKAFPDFSSLARAPLHEILKLWQGLGYNRRAIALKKIAETVVAEYDGSLPSHPDILISLPGIGRYTASAIAAFAFNQPTVIIETNIRTVFIHFFFQERNEIKDTEILPLVETTIDRTNPRMWYYALMDYGAMLKKQYQNPNRRSVHYHKQAPFEGSNRQLRGLILKELTRARSMSERELVEALKKEPERIKEMLIQLQKEGFIQKNGINYQIIACQPEEYS